METPVVGNFVGIQLGINEGLKTDGVTVGYAVVGEELIVGLTDTLGLLVGPVSGEVDGMLEGSIKGDKHAVRLHDSP